MAIGWQDEHFFVGWSFNKWLKRLIFFFDGTAGLMKAGQVSLLNPYLLNDLDLVDEVELIPSPITFADSSHQIVILHSQHLHQVAKCVNRQSIEQSAFWDGMRRLFRFDFDKQLRHFDHLYPWMAMRSVVAVPYWVRHVEQEGRTISVSDWLPGDTAEYTDVSQGWVETLAEQVVSLHQVTAPRAGMMEWPEMPFSEAAQRDLIVNPKVAQGIEDWAQHLTDVLPNWLSQYSSQSAAQWQQELFQAQEALNEEVFAVVMPDLRWDQFLQLESVLVAMTDLDAFVFAPRRLEWVLLEYLIPAEYVDDFVRCYQTHLEIAPLAPVRKIYRAILFAMNVLGESDYDAWMAHPTYLVDTE